MTRVLSQLVKQSQWAAELMDRSNAYAKSIGCTVYDCGPLADVIEVHTSEQGQLLADWWAANAKECP